jgi:hypothetical protein
MNSIRTPGLALAAIAAVATTTACGSSGRAPAAPVAASQPASSPAATTAQPTPRPHTFVSRRYAFRVILTDGWSERDARVDWNGRQLQGLTSPAFADFAEPATGRALVAGAARLAIGTSLAPWRAAMVRAAPSVCTESRAAERTTLGGEPALAWTATCSDGYDVNKLAAIRGTRGYMILLASPTGGDLTANRHVFDAIRRSFRFTRP